jgi:hypothetical protein
MKHFYTILTITAVFISLLISPKQSNAQHNTDSNSKRIELITTNFSEALASSNTGVAESALFHSVLFQRIIKGTSDQQLLEAVKKLYTNSKNDRVRHKAYLVNSLLSQPDGLDSLSIDQLTSEETFYRAVGDLLTHRFIQSGHTE